MVLVMARQEAGPCKQWPKMLKGKAEKQLKDVKVLTENRHSDSLKKGKLTLYQGKMEKGDDVADDYEDDAVRIIVSQRHCVTSDNDTMYRGIIPQDSVYIALSKYQRSKNVGGGGGWTVNTTHLVLGFAPPSWSFIQ
jgi:hypothetical protein